MEFRLLGPLEVLDSDCPLSLGGPKQRSLLAILLLHAGRVVSTERLIDELWGQAPPATVAKSSRSTSPGCASRSATTGSSPARPAICCRSTASSSTSPASSGSSPRRRGGPATAAGEKLREALALWRGPPLADLAYEPFAQAPIARLEELRLGALEQRIDADLPSVVTPSSSASWRRWWPSTRARAACAAS